MHNLTTFEVQVITLTKLKYRAISEFSKSVPELFLYHEKVPELTFRSLRNSKKTTYLYLHLPLPLHLDLYPLGKESFRPLETGQALKE